MTKHNISKAISGKIRVKITSKKPEQLINLAWKKNIELLNIKRDDLYTFTAGIKSEFLQELEELCNETKSSIIVVSVSKGLRFFSNFKTHLTLLSGIGICIGLIVFLSCFIWKIDIKGDKHVSPYEIRQTMRELGIKRGILKFNIDTDKLEEEIILKNKNILWSKVRIQGSTLQVEVVELFKPPVIEIDNSLGDIVASKDGEIVRVYSESGTPVVESGNIVKKGDILIAGYQGKEGGTYEIAPIGSVIAKTFLEFEEVIELEGIKSVNTKNKEAEYYIEIFGKKLYLKKYKNDFKDYDKISNEGSIFKSNIYYEVNKSEYSLDSEQVKKDVVDNYTKNVQQNLNDSDKIVGLIVKDDIIDNKLNLKLTFVIEEEIGYKNKKIEE